MKELLEIALKNSRKTRIRIEAKLWAGTVCAQLLIDSRTSERLFERPVDSESGLTACFNTS